MRWSIATTLLASLGSVRAQVTVCLATYGGSATSVPPPGRSFLLQVIPQEGQIARRQTHSSDSGFLDSTGGIQAQCQQGSIFRLVSGSLFSGPGQISAPRNITSARFGTTDLVKAIDTTFAVAVDESLFWKNDAFDGGTARFGADSSIIFAVFSGSLPDSYIPVSLKALDTANCASLRSFSNTPTLASHSASPLSSTLNANVTAPLQPAFNSTKVSTSRSASSTAIMSRPSFSATNSSTMSYSSRLLSSTVSSTVIPSSLSSTFSLSNTSSLSSTSFSPSGTPMSSSASTAPVSLNTSSVASNSPGPSFPTASIPPQSRDIASRSSASSIISTSSYTDFCTTLLGYTTSEITTVVSMALTATATLTTSPSDDIVTSLETVTSYVTVTEPSMSVTVVKTPIVDATLTAMETGVVAAPATLEARRGQDPSGLVTPAPLQPFESTILSSACSSNIQSATVITITTTVFSTIFQTTWDTEPYATVDSTILAAATTTLEDGINTVFETVPAVTSDFWETNTMVDMTSVLSSTLEEGSSSAPSTTITQSSSVPQISTATQSSTVAQTSSAAQSSTAVQTSPTIQSSPAVQSSQSSSALPTSSAAVTTQSTKSTNICAPTIVLASPTALVGSIHGSTVSVDDRSYQLTLPFDMQIFDGASSSVFVSTNGVLSLDSGTNEFSNECLPTTGPDFTQPAYAVPEYAAFPFWDDTYVYKGDPQGIYYEYGVGDSGPTAVSFEYYLSHYFNDTQYYHYTVFYDSTIPGQFTFRYYQASDNGYSATVGIQNNNVSSPGAPFGLEFFCQTCNDSPNTEDPTNVRPTPPPGSCRPGPVVPGLELVVTTYPNNTGSISQSTFGNCL